MPDKYEHDVTLVKDVHREVRGNFEIYATITRYGELCVFVHELQESRQCVWIGDSILGARQWIDKPRVTTRLFGWARRGLLGS